MAFLPRPFVSHSPGETESDKESGPAVNEFEQKDKQINTSEEFRLAYSDICYSDHGL